MRHGFKSNHKLHVFTFKVLILKLCSIVYLHSKKTQVNKWLW